MQSERFSLRGAILLGLALLAAAAWLATVLGAGTRIRGEDTSEVAAPRLPTLSDAATDPMAAPSSFSAIAERPVFAEDRRPHPFRLGGQPQATPGGALRLTGVLLSGSFGMATLSGDNNRSLRLRLNGEALEGWQLLALEPRRATVLGPDGAQVLELAVFDGQGGQPPTQLRDPGAAAAGPVRPGTAPPSVPAASARAGQATPAGVPAASPAPATHEGPANQGPSEEQMRGIRERIRARREQLQQQQQRQSTPPPGGAANP
jgi:general secretion pathway protein N